LESEIKPDEEKKAHFFFVMIVANIERLRTTLLWSGTFNTFAGLGYALSNVAPGYVLSSHNLAKPWLKGEFIG
jgi:hypothetical protein